MNQNSGLLSAESDRKQLDLRKHQPKMGFLPATAPSDMPSDLLTDSSASTAVVVPIRCFSGALSRLSGVLDDNRRAELMRRMAARVVAAAAPYPTFVATDDAAVSAWACYVGASPMPVGQPGLSAAAAIAVNRLAADGVERVVVAHADLVLARTLSPVVGPGLVIAPDRSRDGSNVVCIPAAAGFCFAYGADSFRRHVAEAERLGIPVTVIDVPTLAVDIDSPVDLLSLPADELASLGLGDLNGLVGKQRPQV